MKAVNVSDSKNNSLTLPPKEKSNTWKSMARKLEKELPKTLL